MTERALNQLYNVYLVARYIWSQGMPLVLQFLHFDGFV